MFRNITIVGNVGKDPVIRQMQNGGIVGNFSVACNDKYVKDGETITRVTWFDVVAYQTGESGLVTALIQKYLFQGQLVFISGEPNIRTWTHQDGSQRRSFEIKLGPQSTIKMLGGRPNGQRADANGHDAPEGEATTGETAPAKERVADDDIPF